MGIITINEVSVSDENENSWKIVSKVAIKTKFIGNKLCLVFTNKSLLRETRNSVYTW